MKHSVGLPLLILLAHVPYATAWSQGAEDTEPARCISLSRINRTEVIDDRTIVFYMRGGDIYINRLRRECMGLEREKRFSYQTVVSRLCRSDNISVLEDTGFGLSRGASCGLDHFMPSFAEEIAILKGVEEEAEITVEEIDPDE